MTHVLPITTHLPAILAKLKVAGCLVLVAPPGTGKTTLLPAALADAVAGKVVVTQPRRLAARMVANYVASVRGETVGGDVGYHVRFESAVSARTRLTFVTEGLLLQCLAGDRDLSGIGAVVVDEFHERHLETDLVLGLLAELRRTTRPDLMLVVMSATVAAEPVAAYLGNAPVYRVDAPVYPVAIEHLAKPDDRPLERQVVQALHRAVAAADTGDALVFLPGVAEIERARATCQAAFTERLVLPLHGSLSPAEQQRAVSPAERRKIILSTNVAETSVTIDGVTLVVDSGLVRRARHDPWTGMPGLQLENTSQAESIQRAGRAGRTQPGRCSRLFTEHEFKVRAKFAPPDIAGADLADAILLLTHLGVADVGAFRWFEAPPDYAVAAAHALLRELGAVDATHGLTPLGRQLTTLRLHPRLGRIFVEAATHSSLPRAARFVAVLAEVPQVLRTAAADRQVWQGPSDPLAWLEDLEHRKTRWPEAAVRSVKLTAGQLQRQWHGPERIETDDDVLLRAVLVGFPDRVARRRVRGSADLVFADGGSARQDKQSVAQDAEWVVVTVADRQQTGATTRVVARAVSRIEPEWLLDAFPERVVDEGGLTWDDSQRRVLWHDRLRFGQLVLTESWRSPPEAQAEAAEKLLAERVLAMDVRQVDPSGQLARLGARLDYVRQGHCDVALPSLSQLLVNACLGLTALSELQARVAAGPVQRLEPAQVKVLDRAAPDKVRLPSGRDFPVHYAPGQAPWIESYLQDFFGQRDTPQAAGGPLVLHLWAPNKRAVQVTRDLVGFWKNHYPALRQELMRKYPRHTWPENPLTAPPQRTKRSNRG